MTTIVTRAGKGSPLTNTEMDTNLTNLNADKLEVTTAAATYAAKGANSDITSMTALTAPTVAANPLRASDSQSQATTRFTSAGTADAITGTLTPTPTLADGLIITCTPPGANTVTAPTINVNSTGAKKQFKRDASGSAVALAAGDYNASGPFRWEYKESLDSANGGWILIDPLPASVSGHGQCYLSLSAGSLKLSPKDGNRLIVNGVSCTVPDAGVTLAATGLSATTLYYIYATQSGGTINALEASTTTHATSTTAGNKGIEIKSGDDNRTLVGMAYVKTAATFADSVTQRFVLSYFNRRSISCAYNFGSNRSTTSASYIITNTSDIVEYITWADEVVVVTGTVSMGSGSVNTFGLMYPSIDGNTVNVQQAQSFTWASGNYVSVTITAGAKTSEGYHSSSIYYASNGTVTLTVQSTYSSISAILRG